MERKKILLVFGTRRRRLRCATIEEFDSNNTRRLNPEETKSKIASLEYIQNELNGVPNIVK